MGPGKVDPAGGVPKDVAGEGVLVTTGGARSCASAGSASPAAAEIVNSRLVRTLAHIRFKRMHRDFFRLHGQKNQAADDEHQDE
jgi:hypothetical protein